MLSVISVGIDRGKQRMDRLELRRRPSMGVSDMQVPAPGGSNVTGRRSDAAQPQRRTDRAIHAHRCFEYRKIDPVLERNQQSVPRQIGQNRVQRVPGVIGAHRDEGKVESTFYFVGKDDGRAHIKISVGNVDLQTGFSDRLHVLGIDIDKGDVLAVACQPAAYVPADGPGSDYNYAHVQGFPFPPSDFACLICLWDRLTPS